MGAQIRALRMRKGWSLAELGTRIGRSRQYVNRVENGSMAPPISVYADFARALGVALADLLPEGGASRPSDH